MACPHPNSFLYHPGIKSSNEVFYEAPASLMDAVQGETVSKVIPNHAEVADSHSTLKHQAMVSYILYYTL